MRHILLLIIFISCSGLVEQKSLKPRKVVKKRSDYNQDITSKGSNYFVEVTDELGLKDVRSVRNYVIDINDDGREDIVILPDVYSSPEFYIQTKKGTFVQSKDIFFDQPVKASFLIFDDFDRDKKLDVMVVVHNQRSALTERPIRVFSLHRKRKSFEFRENLKYNFKDTLPITSISPIDFNYDGYLDFYVGTWFDVRGKNKVITDKLYHYNNGIVDATSLLKKEDEQREDVLINATPTYGVSQCDINNDGYVDILTSSSAGFKNKLWIGHPGPNYHFTNEAQVIGFDQDSEGQALSKGGGNSTYAICHDYNNDGFMDIAQGEISHSYDVETKDRSSILTGEGLKALGSFIRSEYISDRGLVNWTQADQRAIWFDYNNDGLVDLLIENTGYPPLTRTILFEQLSDHELIEVSSKAGIDFVNPVGSAIFDYNNDGLMDLIISQSNIRDTRIKSKIRVFKNNLNAIRPESEKNNFLKIKLIGKKSNTNGVGAKVTITDSKGKRQTKWVQNTYGPFPSASTSILHFGLGASDIEEVVVSWPYRKNRKQKISTYKRPFVRANEINLIYEH